MVPLEFAWRMSDPDSFLPPVVLFSSAIRGVSEVCPGVRALSCSVYSMAMALGVCFFCFKGVGFAVGAVVDGRLELVLLSLSGGGRQWWIRFQELWKLGRDPGRWFLAVCFFYCDCNESLCVMRLLQLVVGHGDLSKFSVMTLKVGTTCKFSVIHWLQFGFSLI